MKRIVVLLFATASAVVLLLCPFFFVQAQQDMFSAFDAPLPSEASSSSATASENSYDSYSSNSFQSVAQAFEANPSLAADTSSVPVAESVPEEDIPLRILSVSTPETVTSENIGLKNGVYANELSVKNGFAEVQAENDIDNLLLFLAPPFNNLNNINYALSSLKPLVEDGNVRVAIKENEIGETVLLLVSRQDLDPDIRLKAASGILNPLAKDGDVSGEFKEKIGKVLEGIVFKEQAAGANAQKINNLKTSSLVSLNRIMEDQDVCASYKESLLDSFLGLKDDPLFNEGAFTAIETITIDQAVSPAEKERVFPALLAITEKLRDTEPKKAKIVLSAVENIVDDQHVSAAVKETAVQPVLAWVTNKATNDLLKVQEALLLQSLAQDSRISGSSKEKIMSKLTKIVPKDESLISAFNTVTGRISSAILYDKDVSPAAKEKAIDLFLPALSVKNIPAEDVGLTIQNIGAILQDSEVGAAGKEKVVQPLENFITAHLEDMQTNTAWRDVLSKSLGDLTIIMNDPAVSQNAKDGIKTWISGLDIFTTHTKEIWEQFNTVVLSTKNAFFNAQTLTAVYNVLEALPESFRPGSILLESFSEKAVEGWYDYASSQIKINADGLNTRVPHYEKALLSEMGHYVVLAGKVDTALVEAFDPLWDGTSSYLDCASPYGYKSQDEDMSTVFREYVSDTDDLVGRAVLLANNPAGQNDLLLRKVEAQAKFYLHTVPGSQEKYIYSFSIDSDTGSITRMRMMLSNHDINGKKYFLPNTTKVSKTDIFKKDIPL